MITKNTGDHEHWLRPLLAPVSIDFPICGGNCMGFYNLDHDLLLTFARPPYATRAGGATLISHSGSSWSAMSLNNGRMGYNLTISSGQELTVTVADYLDYAVEQASTAVVGLILETIRDPDGFRRALAKANEKQIPVVALKVGRSDYCRPIRGYRRRCADCSGSINS